MTTVIKAAGPGDFLALVPQLLGFAPRESIVLVPFKANRTIGAMRVDLPTASEASKTAATLVGMMCRVPEADAVAAVVYTERDALYATAMLDAVQNRLNHSGLRVVDMLYVTSEGWGSTADPRSPRPLSELPPSKVTGDVLDPTILPTINDERRKATVESGFEPEQDIVDINGFIEDVLYMSASTLAPRNVAALSFIFDRPALRDILLVQVTQGRERGEDALDAQLNWEQGVEYPADLAMSMWGEGPRPDASRLDCMLELARWTTAILPTAGGYAVCAWISWALGRSTHAEHYANQGLALDADHGLCEIVRSFITAGHLPAWAFTRKEDM